MADDLRLDVNVVASQAGVPQVIAGMNALAASAGRAQAASQRFSAASMSNAAALRSVNAQMRSGNYLADFTRGAGQAAGAARDAAGGMDQFSDANARYASYDMANTLLQVAGAIKNVGQATAVAFAEQERAFTEVERILGIDPDVDLSSITNLREELRSLTEEVPVAFSELSEIASFGAALDIPAEQLDEFSSTVSRFVAITDVSAEQAGKSLARIYQYTRGDDVYRGAEAYEQIGSAILRLGNVSIATEAEVLSFSQALSPLGAQFGVHADQIIAMATATASFANINVEGAGSAFSRVFAIIERNVKGGSDNLSEFARISGLSAESFTAAWDKDAGGAFNEVIRGLSEDVPNLVTNLDELGIRNVRDQRVIRALAIQYESYTRYLEDSNKALGDGTALGDAYSYVMDDLASRWQIFLNVIQNTAADVGATLAPAFSGLLTVVTETMKALGDFASSPIGSWVVRIAAGVAGMVAVWAAWRGAIALATASSLAFKTATAFLGSASISRGATWLAASITGVGTSAQGATGKVAALGAAQAAAGAQAGVMRRGLAGVVGFLGGPFGLVLGIAGAGVATFIAESTARVKAGRAEIVNDLMGIADGAKEAAEAFKTASLFEFADDGFGPPGSGSPALFGSSITQAELFSQAMRDVDRTMDVLWKSTGTGAGQLNALAAEFGWTDQQSTTFLASLSSINKVLQQAADDGNLVKAVRGLGESQGWTEKQTARFVSTTQKNLIPALREQAEQIGINTQRTDWLNQLLSESGAAAVAAGDGTTYLAAEQEAAAEAHQASADAVEELIGMLKEYSTVTGGVQANLDSLWSTINDFPSALDDFAEAGGSVADLMEGGMQPASITLREEMRKLTQDSLEAAAGILEAGGSVEDANNAFRDGRQPIIDFFTEMGVGEEVAKSWANANLGSFNDVIDLIEQTGQAVVDLNGERVTIAFDADTGKFYNKKTGAEIAIDELNGLVAEPTVDADTTPADGKMKEANRKVTELDRRIAKPTTDMNDDLFIRGLNTTTGHLDRLNRIVSRPSVDLYTDALYNALRAAQSAINSIQGKTVELTVVQTQIHRSIEETGRPELWRHTYDSGGGFAGGGYTGPGGKYEPAGIVHKGEYVIPKSMVNQATGLPFADALGKLTRGHNSGAGYANGGYVRGHSVTTEQGPVDLSAASLQALARLIPTQLVANGRVLASVNSSENEKSTARGAM